MRSLVVREGGKIDRCVSICTLPLQSSQAVTGRCWSRPSRSSGCQPGTSSSSRWPSSKRRSGTGRWNDPIDSVPGRASTALSSPYPWYPELNFPRPSRSQHVQTGTRIGIGVLVTACLFALLIFFVGIEEFLEAVTSMDPQLAAAVVSAIAVRRLFHGLIVYAAFARFEVTVSYLQAVFISASVSFAKKATPLAQLSGEPIAAGIITDAIDDTYEDSLAAISVIETVKFVPAMTVFVVGSTYFVVFPTVIPSSIKPIFGLFGAVLLLVPLVGIVLWSYKDRAEAIATAAVVALANAVSVIPRVPSPNEEDVRNRISGFSSRFVDLTTNRRLVAELSILTFCTLFLTVLALWIGNHRRHHLQRRRLLDDGSRRRPGYRVRPAAFEFWVR
ncbi:hypothetical protein BRC73_02485 [Halobacteriales archaeon QH_7_66_37]|nr:MAG: hypothetical protein BRC73_02485 [Halobacteriales archaeon QH_7_66_37]